MMKMIAPGSSGNTTTMRRSAAAGSYSAVPDEKDATTDDDDPRGHLKVQPDNAWCNNIGAKLFTVALAIFVFGDLSKQLGAPPVMTDDQQQRLSLQLSSAVTAAGATIQAAKTYVSSALFDPRGNGLLGSVVANSTVQPGWGWETIGGASVTQWTPVSATGPTEAAGAVTMRFPGAAEQHKARHRRDVLTGNAPVPIAPLTPTILFKFKKGLMNGTTTVAAAAAVATNITAAAAANGSHPTAAALPQLPHGLSPGDILVLRLKIESGYPDVVRAVEVSVGADGCGDGEDFPTVWSPPIQLHELAPSLATVLASVPDKMHEGIFPLPPIGRSKSTTNPTIDGLKCKAWTTLRVRYTACDTWGHIQGDSDCDMRSPPDALLLAVESISLRGGGGALAARAQEASCEPLNLLTGRGRSCALDDACTVQSLYSPLVFPKSDRRFSSLTIQDAGAFGQRAGMLEGFEPAVLSEGTEIGQQGFRCTKGLLNTKIGCRIARGWSTHKAVWRGTFTDDLTLEEIPVVVKEGALRFPVPFKGERGVGFDGNETGAAQRATMQTMWYEMAQEVYMLEMLAGHPGIPRQIAACVDSSGLVATSVQTMARVPLGTKKDLAAICERAKDPAKTAFTLAKSIVSLFKFLTEDRFLRLEDLHWQLFDLTGNVRQNFSDVSFNMYDADDISQFAVDSEEGLNFMLIDLDKIVVNHDEMLRWYVAEVMMPYVAAQLFPPLQEFLPGLAVAIGRMSHKRVLVRPPSFACVRDWLAAPGAFEALSRRKGTAAGAAKGASPWPPLPCNPKEYNKDLMPGGRFAADGSDE